MLTLLWILAFSTVLLVWLVLFLLLEAIALSDKDDNLHTLSTYIKRARRRHPVVVTIILSLAIFGPAIWLWGHLGPLEAW